MGKIFTFLFFLGTAGLLSGQLNIDPTTFAYTIDKDGSASFSMTITNTEANDYQVWWRIVKGEDWPAEWQTILCDKNLCYAPNVDECPATKPNAFSANETDKTFSLKVNANGVAGSSTLHMEFYSDKDFTNKIGSTTEGAVFVASTPSNTVNVDLSSIVLYPNPTYDYFSIKNDANVAKVSLINVLGSEVWTKTHKANAKYNVTDLYKGMYVVRLIDANGKLIKTMRLNKMSI